MKIGRNDPRPCGNGGDWQPQVYYEDGFLWAWPRWSRPRKTGMTGTTG
jgi:hypothetical protein